MNEIKETRTIVVEDDVPHSPEKVWRALTQAALISDWLMPNDFAPIVGNRFTFTTKPMGSWDGIVHCQVLAVEPLRKLQYSWKGGSDENGKFGSKLDSVVTWTLSAVSGGTHLRLEHSGFKSPGNDFAYDVMNPGWGNVLAKIASVAARA